MNKLKYKWMVSYSITILFAVMVCNIAFFAYQNSFKEIIIDLQESVSDHIGRSLDSNMNIMRQSAQLIDTSSIITDDFFYEDENDIRFLKYRKLEAINSLIITASAVDMFYIYIPTIDKVLMPKSVYTPELAYNAYHKNSNLNFDEWHKLISAEKQSKFYLDYINLNDSVTEIPFMLYIHSAETKSGKPYNIIVFSKLSNSWSEKNDFVTKNNFSIFESGKIVYTGMDFELDENFDIETNYQNFYINKINSKKYVIIKFNSQYINWVYTFFVPYNIYWSKLFIARNIIVFASFFGTLSSLLLLWYLTGLNYAPIQRIFSMLSENKTTDVDNITKKIQALLNEKDNLALQNSTMTQNIILERLLKGYLAKNEHSLSLLLKNGIRFNKSGHLFRYFALRITHASLRMKTTQ